MLQSCNHYRVPELFHRPRKETSYPLSSHSQFSASPQFLATTNLLSLNEFAYSGYFIYMTWGAWLLSLSIAFSRFICAAL